MTGADPSARDPQTPAEWQDAVDTAHVLILIDSSRLYGLVATDLRPNVERCEEVLERGKALGFEPTEYAVDRLLKAGSA